MHACERGRGRRATRRRGLRAVIQNLGEERRQHDLTRREPLDEAHGRATARTRPRARDDDGWRGRWRRRDREDRSTRREIVRATARCEQPEVANADEALREDMEEEAAEKLLRLERERPHLTAVAIVLPPKGHGVVGQRRRVGGSRSPRGGCTGRDSAARGTGSRRAAWRTRPTPGDRAIARRCERRRQA